MGLLNNLLQTNVLPTILKSSYVCLDINQNKTYHSFTNSGGNFHEVFQKLFLPKEMAISSFNKKN